MDIQVFSGSKEIPYILNKLSVSIDGTIFDKEGKVVSLMRMFREGRHYGTTPNKITKVD